MRLLLGLLGGALGLLAGLLGLLDLLLLLQGGVGVGGDTTAGDGDILQQVAELVVSADSQGQHAGADAGGLLAGSLDADLEQLPGEIRNHAGGVGACGLGDALGEAALAEEGTNATAGEDGVGLTLAGGLLGLGTLLGRDHCCRDFSSIKYRNCNFF
eukprot:233880_1